LLVGAGILVFYGLVYFLYWTSKIGLAEWKISWRRRSVSAETQHLIEKADDESPETKEKIAWVQLAALIFLAVYMLTLVLSLLWDSHLAIVYLIGIVGLEHYSALLFSAFLFFLLAIGIAYLGFPRTIAILPLMLAVPIFILMVYARLVLWATNEKYTGLPLMNLPVIVTWVGLQRIVLTSAIPLIIGYRYAVMTLHYVYRQRYVNIDVLYSDLTGLTDDPQYF
jgi:hypothetical protein